MPLPTLDFSPGADDGHAMAMTWGDRMQFNQLKRWVVFFLLFSLYFRRGSPQPQCKVVFGGLTIPEKLIALADEVVE
jgi:hypothetical protein